MKELEKLLEYLYMIDDMTFIFYDKKLNRAIIVEEDLLKEGKPIITRYLEDDRIEEMDIETFNENIMQYIPLPKPKNINIMKDYAKKILKRN